MAWSLYDTDTSTGDKFSEFAQATKDRTDALRINELGAADPANLTNGMTWLVSISATEYERRAYVDGAVVALYRIVKTGNKLKLVQPLDFDANQAVGFILERLVTANLPTPGAANEGRASWDDSRERGVLTGTTRSDYVARAAVGGTTYMRLPARLHVGGLGTPATADTSTELGGWLLDAVGEELLAVAEAPVPEDFTDAHDCALVAACLLKNAETAGDDIDMGGSWRAVTPNADAGSKAATAFTAVAQDIGSAAAQYSLHEVVLAMPYNDATNPIDAGDRLQAKLTRNGLTNVAGVIVVSAHFRVPVWGFAA